MKTSIISLRHSTVALFAAIACGLIVSPDLANAKQGATDPIPGTSNGTVKSGGGSGGGGSKSVPVPVTPTATPVPVVVNTQPLVIAPLTFTAAASVNGYVPICTGDYRIDPYYPTLSLMTINVQTSAINLPDSTPLYVTVNLAGGVGYPFTSNIIFLAAGAGSCSLSEYITPGSVITSITVTDASGAVIFAGN